MRGKVEVLNVGVSGYASNELSERMASDLLEWEADMVICYTGWNDLKRLMLPDPSQLSQFANVTGLVTLKRYSIFLSLCHSLKERLFPTPDEPIRYWNGQAASGSVKRGLANYRKQLNEIIRAARAREMQVALSNQANLVSPELPRIWENAENYTGLRGEELSQAWDAVHLLHRELADQHGLLLIDLPSAVPKDQEHLVDHIHLTNAGARAVAEEMARALKASLPSSDTSPP